jgi:hypothetical protein
LFNIVLSKFLLGCPVRDPLLDPFRMPIFYFLFLIASAGYVASWLGLEIFWGNNRWQRLFPHAAFNPARN